MKHVFYLFLLLALSSLTFHKDDFQDVIDATENETIKKKLIAFQDQGIEREVDTKEYHVDDIIAFSKTYLGTRHQMRGTTKKGIDCSGLMMVVHSKFSISLPHSSHEQARYGKVISNKEKLKKGDLVFFYNSYNSPNLITHAGLYVGDNEFIHASNSKGVIISNMDDKYWAPKYLFATRLK